MKLDGRILTLLDILLIVLKGGAAIHLKGDIGFKSYSGLFGWELKMLASFDNITKYNN